MKEWVPTWLKRNWKTSTGSDPENIELIKLVYLMVEQRPGKVEVGSSELSLDPTRLEESLILRTMKIQFSWVKAHIGTEGNEAADRFAVRGAGMEPVPPRDFDAELNSLLAKQRELKKSKLLSGTSSSKQLPISSSSTGRSSLPISRSTSGTLLSASTSSSSSRTDYSSDRLKTKPRVQSVEDFEEDWLLDPEDEAAEIAGY